MLARLGATIFGDMNFGTKTNSEDCLYLNIWTPAKTMKEHLPVLIYFNGGGLMAGSGSEPMDRHGNTSAASIPVALNELAESGQLKPGQLLACIGFGGGLTWGGAIFQYKECV